MFKKLWIGCVLQDKSSENCKEFNPTESKLLKAGMYISGISILIMMMLTVVDVILKNFFGSSIPGAYVYSQNYLMPLAIFLGIPYAFFTGIFPRVDLFITKFRKQTQLKIMVAVLITEVIAYIIIAYYSFSYGIFGATTNITFVAGINSVPLYPMFFLVTLGFGVLSIYLICAIKKW